MVGEEELHVEDLHKLKVWASCLQIAICKVESDSMDGGGPDGLLMADKPHQQPETTDIPVYDFRADKEKAKGLLWLMHVSNSFLVPKCEEKSKLFLKKRKK